MEKPTPVNHDVKFRYAPPIIQAPTRYLVLVTGRRLVVQTLAHVHPQPRRRCLVPHPHIVN